MIIRKYIKIILVLINFILSIKEVKTKNVRKLTFDPLIFNNIQYEFENFQIVISNCI